MALHVLVLLVCSTTLAVVSVDLATNYNSYNERKTASDGDVLSDNTNSTMVETTPCHTCTASIGIATNMLEQAVSDLAALATLPFNASSDSEGSHIPTTAATTGDAAAKDDTAFASCKASIDAIAKLFETSLTNLTALTVPLLRTSTDMVNREEEDHKFRAALGHESLTKTVKKSVTQAFTEQKVNGSTLMETIMKQLADYMDARHRAWYSATIAPATNDEYSD